MHDITSLRNSYKRPPKYKTAMSASCVGHCRKMEREGATNLIHFNDSGIESAENPLVDEGQAFKHGLPRLWTSSKVWAWPTITLNTTRSTFSSDSNNQQAHHRCTFPNLPSSRGQISWLATSYCRIRDSCKSLQGPS